MLYCCINISFVNNHASESGRWIFVSQILGVNTNKDCSFKLIPSYPCYVTKTVLNFVKNTDNISGIVLYGGKISNYSHFNFDHQFHSPKQTGLSVVSSDPIQVCFCESNRQNCFITNIKITAMLGIGVNISLSTLGLKDGLTGCDKIDNIR